MNFSKTIIAATLSAACLLPALQVSAQTTPYSKYGYGILNDQATSAQRAMGGVGYAMSSGRQVNVMNPASYAAIDSLTFLFDMGISMTKQWSHETSEGVRYSAQDFGGSLDYITMQFPVAKNMGMAIGLVPVSTVNYGFASTITNGTVSRTGDGGLNWLFAGYSIRPFKGFSVGANFGYLFGSVVNDTYAYTTSGSETLFETQIQVRDYHMQFGVQYGYNINRNNRLTAGVSFTPGKSLLGHAYGLSYDVTQSTVADTIGYTSLHHKYTLPAVWGFGLNWQWKEKLMVEANYTYSPWGDAKFPDIDSNEQSLQFNNRSKYALGVQYTPKTRGNYFELINYRCGGFYEDGYVKVLGNTIKEYGASVGLGLPTPAGKTIINLGVEWRHRQASPAALITENYINFTIGVNFNERWFYKNKIR
jgi:hypothetical protein